MPQALIPVLAGILGSTLAATIVATAIFYVATTLITGMLMGGGSQKAEAGERTVRSPRPPRVYVLGGVRRVFGSQMLFSNGTDRSTLDVWAFCEGPISAVVQVFLNDDRVTLAGGYVQQLSDGSYKSNKAMAGYTLGPTPNVAPAAITAVSGGDWTANHRGDGIVTGYLRKIPVKSEDFLEVFPQGDNVTMSLAVEGMLVHDPREVGCDPDDPSTWVYRTNAVLLHLWFLMVFKGKDYATKFLPVEAMWIDAADIADEAVALAEGGTEPRYRGAILFSADMNPAQIEDDIRRTYDGWTAPDEHGCIRVFAGKLYVPTVTLDEHDIIDYQLRKNVPIEDRLNEIILRTYSPDHDYQEVECESWRDEDRILANGEINTTRTYQVPSYAQGRRLSKRDMARANPAASGAVSFKRSGLPALRERFVNLLIQEGGITLLDEVVEVIAGERVAESGGGALEFIVVDANIDAWNAVTEQGEPAPSGDKVYLTPLDAPVIAGVTVLTDDTGAARVEIEVDAPGYEGVTWFTRWREQGSTSWLVEQQEVEGLLLTTSQVPIGVTVEVSAAYTVNGQLSPWADTEEIDTEEIIFDGGDP